MYCLRLIWRIFLYTLPTLITYYVMSALNVYGWIPDITLLAIGVFSVLMYIKGLHKIDLYKAYTKPKPTDDNAKGLNFPYHKTSEE